MKKKRALILGWTVPLITQHWAVLLRISQLVGSALWSSSSVTGPNACLLALQSSSLHYTQSSMLTFTKPLMLTVHTLSLGPSICISESESGAKPHNCQSPMIHLLQINKALISLTWVSSGMSFLSIPICWKRKKHFNKVSGTIVCTETFSARKNHLCNFEELWNPSHSCQESLVDLQPIFTLTSLHLEKFFWKRQTVKCDIPEMRKRSADMLFTFLF